jgi:uncharacterized membrane protein SpoIIM required for sporulation
MYSSTKDLEFSNERTEIFISLTTYMYLLFKFIINNLYNIYIHKDITYYHFNARKRKCLFRLNKNNPINKEISEK